MADKNGYFAVISGGNGTHLELWPEEGNGSPLSVKEIGDYLDDRKLEYSPTRLRSMVDSKSRMDLPLSAKPLSYKINEEVKLRVSNSRMEVIARFYPPCGGTLVTADELRKDMIALKIKAQLDEEVVKAFRAEPRYCTDIVIARGTEPKDGTDGSIEYLFNTDPSVKPTMNKDGSVDYFHLNTVVVCSKGQELAKLTPEIPGEPGVDVYGDRLSPRDVKHVQFKYGRNIKVSEDGRTLISDLEGHVNLVEGQVFVSGVLELENVDTSTGNIEDYQGNLLVKGNICAGFTVRATGDIEVRGVIEGAHVESGGQISVARGVNGMGKGVLKARTNVIAKYIENSNVEAGNYVQTECIMNSNVTAKETITVEGRKGFISGGIIRAGKTVSAKSIGTEMGIDTSVEVGADPEKRARFLDMQKENQELKKKIEKTSPMLVVFKKKLAAGEKFSPEQVKQLKLLSDGVTAWQKRISENEAAIEAFEKELEETAGASIVVTETVFPGTKLQISDTSIVLKKPYSFCKFVKKGADVRMVTLR